MFLPGFPVFPLAVMFALVEALPPGVCSLVCRPRVVLPFPAGPPCKESKLQFYNP